MIVTEFMTGGSLLDLFKSNNSFSMWRAVQLALDCARGMAYLHNRAPHAVIHRGAYVALWEGLFMLLCHDQGHLIKSLPPYIIDGRS